MESALYVGSIFWKMIWAQLPLVRSTKWVFFYKVWASFVFFLLQRVWGVNVRRVLLGCLCVLKNQLVLSPAQFWRGLLCSTALLVFTNSISAQDFWNATMINATFWNQITDKVIKLINMLVGSSCKKVVCNI